MKITSGKYKYRNIEVPKGIRPTTEKVREAVFSMIMQWLPDAEVLDLFAGSGAMGLEALSRGAAHCTFVEYSRQNQKILTGNIANCGAGSEASVIGRDYTAALAEIADRREKPVFDVVIIDPPYEMTTYYDTAMELLQQYGLIDERSVVICEHLYDNKLSDTYGEFSRIKEKKYGTIGVDAFTIL
ncbi:MAG: 16S rRNA (guanine(966)-N(2))-methyltransferase RsmD [Mogibacterium sp.]|nr:16S rRNA (guanine(966)-N(2))-methyltransferase RsmD [Mogibacterium sp.]